MTTIGPTLKSDPLCFIGIMGKHFLNIITQKLWSRGIKATSQAGSLIWQCVRVPVWYSFWRYDSCRDEGFYIDARAWHHIWRSEGLLVKVQSRLQWRAQETGNANTMGSPPRMVASMEWRESKPGTRCVFCGRWSCRSGSL